MASTTSSSSFTAVNEGDFARVVLHGKMIIKVEYDADIRKIPLLADEITYDELLLMMQRLFKLQPTDELELKYRDEDNDLVSISDGNDLSFAIQCSGRLLKLKLFVNAKSAAVSFNDRTVIRGELIEIRNRCIELLDKLNLVTVEDSTPEVKDGDTKQQKIQKVYSDPPEELDPLNKSVRSALANVEAASIKSAKSDTEVPKSEAFSVVPLNSPQPEPQTTQQQTYSPRQPLHPQFSGPGLVQGFGGPPQVRYVVQPPPQAFSQGINNQQSPSRPTSVSNIPSNQLPDPNRRTPPPSMSCNPSQQFGAQFVVPASAFGPHGLTYAQPPRTAHLQAGPMPPQGAMMPPGTLPPPQIMSGPAMSVTGQTMPRPPFGPPPSVGPGMPPNSGGNPFSMPARFNYAGNTYMSGLGGSGEQ